MSEPTRSQFATELDCLRARDKYFTARIEELQRREAMLVDALTRIQNEDIGTAKCVAIAYKALSATSADSAAWLEQKHVEWIGDPVGRVVHGNVYPMHDRYPEGFIYALPTKEIAG